MKCVDYRIKEDLIPTATRTRYSDRLLSDPWEMLNHDLGSPAQQFDVRQQTRQINLIRSTIPSWMIFVFFLSLTRARTRCGVQREKVSSRIIHGSEKSLSVKYRLRILESVVIVGLDLFKNHIYVPNQQYLNNKQIKTNSVKETKTWMKRFFFHRIEIKEIFLTTFRW